MVKLFVIPFALVLLASSFFVIPLPAKAEPKTITVPDDYSTIQAAIGNASAGDTVFVRNGVYNGTRITIDKALSLIGENRQETIVIGVRGYISPLGAIHVTADNVTISGFAIKDSDLGILIEDSYEHVPSGCQIIDNDIVNNGEGIVTRGKTISVVGNNIAGSGSYGISVSSSNTTISGNTITDSGYSGMIVDMSENVTISGNTVTYNGVNEKDGPIKFRGGLNLRWNGPFYVYGNKIDDNKGYGIQLGEGCNNATIYDNSINRNSIGIKLLNFVLGGDATIGLDNSVYRNNLIGNSQQALVEATYGYAGNSKDFALVNGTDVVVWDNGKEGNYWSDYQSRYPNAVEAGSSGIGDTPYVIDENNLDNYPFLRPLDISTGLTPSTTSLLIILVIAVAIILVLAIAFLAYRARTRRRGSFKMA